MLYKYFHGKIFELMIYYFDWFLLTWLERNYMHILKDLCFLKLFHSCRFCYRVSSTRALSLGIAL